MLVKCKCHGEKIDKAIAYKVSKGSKNDYYCSKGDYDSIVAELDSKKEVFDACNRIFGYVVVNTALFKEVHDLGKIYSYRLLLSLLNDKSDYLEKTLSAKDFTSEYGKIRYVFAIIRNNIKDYQVIQKQEIVKQVDDTVYDEPTPPQRVSRSGRKGLVDYTED